MEAAAAGQSMQAQTSQTLVKSPKKSPKKYPRFNHSSPKKTLSSSPSNIIPQVDSTTLITKNSIKILTRPQNDPSTSRTQPPFPRRQPNEALISAIENNRNNSSKSEDTATSPSVPTVDSLVITVQNSASTQRVVESQSQNSQNSQVVVQNDAPKPHVLRFPQSRPFQFDNPPQKRAQNKSAYPRPQGKNRGNANANGQFQHRPSWRDYRAGRRGYEDDDDDYYRRVVVTGFPAYTKADELVKKLSSLGSAQIELIKNRVAVVIFDNEQEASDALRANNKIPVYGTILTIMKYTTRKHVMDLIRSNRKVVRNEHIGPPIAAPGDIDLAGDFDQQMQNIEEAIRLTQEEVANINLLFEDVEKYMRMIFPTCEAVPFGSITTGQGIKSSDADCFLSLSPGSLGRPGPGAAELCSQFVSRAARLLRLYPEVFARLVPIPRANTPIIKFLHVPTNVNCDLNSKTPLGVQNSRLLGHLLGAHPSLGRLALLLKYWARVQQLSGSGRLTNYALLLLLVFYLQQTLLPPVYKLQGPEHSFIVEHWEAGFDLRPLAPARAEPAARALLGGFFTFYDSFDFDDLVVCPLIGRPLRKAEFESGLLPPQYALYERNIREGLALGIRTNSPLCVQDPFELSHNVASAVSDRLAHDIRAHIKLAAAAFKQEESYPGDFLRTILFTRPATPPGAGDARLAARLLLPARTLLQLEGEGAGAAGAGAGGGWRAALRGTLIDMYRDLLFVDLTRGETASKEPNVDREVYIGCINRPIWRRGNNLTGRCTADEMLAWHCASVTSIIKNAQLPDVHVPFEVEFQFRENPRGFSMLTWPLDGAEMDAFHAFRKFSHTFIHRWNREFLKPYLIKDPPRQEPAKTTPKSPKRTPRKPAEPNTKKPATRSDLAPIESVAFVNSNHKDLTESVAAISLIDSSKLTRDNNDAT